MDSSKRQPSNQGGTPLSRLLLAILPVMVTSLHFREAFFMGILAGISLWPATILLRLTASMPPEVSKAAAVLGLGILAGIGMMLWGAPPFWAVSIYLLLPAKEDNGSSVLWRSLGFIFLMTYLSVLQQGINQVSPLRLFQLPVGTLLLLIPFSFFIQEKKV